MWFLLCAFKGIIKYVFLAQKSSFASFAVNSKIRMKNLLLKLDAIVYYKLWNNSLVANIKSCDWLISSFEKHETACEIKKDFADNSAKCTHCTSHRSII